MPTLSEEIVDEVQNRSESLEGLPRIRMVAISLGYTFVELDNGTMGVCFTPPGPTANPVRIIPRPEHWQKSISLN
jgi:hypothetical protein